MLKLQKPATDGIVHLKAPIIYFCPNSLLTPQVDNDVAHTSVQVIIKRTAEMEATKKLLMGMSLSSKL